MGVPTPNERKALGFLVVLALSGSGVRLWRARHPPPPPPAAAIERQLARADSARQAPRVSARRSTARAAKTTPTWPLDLDRATAAELDALPGIGPALAARIVGHRDSMGAFGSLDALCEVRGIGPATARRLGPLVTFSAPRRPVSARCDDALRPARKSRASGAREQR